MPAPLRVLQVIPAFYPATRYGGPIESVYRLCKALPEQGVEVDVVTTDTDGDGHLDVVLNEATSYGGVPVRYFHRFPRHPYTVSLDLVRYLLSLRPGDYDLLHITALFTFCSTAAALVARRSGIPYVLSTRGILRPWTLKKRSWKKMPYWSLIERGNVMGAAGLHTTSEAERDEVSALLPKSRVFLVPNGVDLEEPPEVRRLPNRIVFVGRLDPVKGFDVLIPALGRLAKTMPEVETVLIGPDDTGEWARIEARIAAEDPRPNVRWLGPVHGAEKLRMMAEATVLVLTSHSENFGQVVVEALSCGTPVVVSRNCPWKSVEEEGAGAWVENTPQEVAAALAKIIGDPRLAAAMGEAARRLAARFAWPRVAKQMAAEYNAALGVPFPVVWSRS